MAEPLPKILLIIIAIIIPPLAVFLVDGIGTQFWISLVLTILSFGTLGWIHGLWVVLTKS